MSLPPSGYDDESVIPVQRLKRLLGELEEELDKVQSVFHQHVPGEFHMTIIMETRYISLRASAQELGSEFRFLIEKLIGDYEHFRDQPDQEKLDQIFKDVKSLQLLLTG